MGNNIAMLSLSATIHNHHMAHFLSQLFFHIDIQPCAKGSLSFQLLGAITRQLLVALKTVTPQSHDAHAAWRWAKRSDLSTAIIDSQWPLHMRNNHEIISASRLLPIPSSIRLVVTTQDQTSEPSATTTFTRLFLRTLWSFIFLLKRALCWPEHPKWTAADMISSKALSSLIRAWLESEFKSDQACPRNGEWTQFKTRKILQKRKGRQQSTTTCRSNFGLENALSSRVPQWLIRPHVHMCWCTHSANNRTDFDLTKSWRRRTCNPPAQVLFLLRLALFGNCFLAHTLEAGAVDLTNREEQGKNTTLPAMPLKVCHV